MQKSVIAIQQGLTLTQAEYSRQTTSLVSEAKSQLVELASQLAVGLVEEQKAVGDALTANTASIRNSVQSTSQELVSANAYYSKQVVELIAQTKAVHAELCVKLSAEMQQNQKNVGAALTENAVSIRNSIQATHHDIMSANAEYNKNISDIVAKTKEQVAVLDAALTEELQKSLQSLGRQLTALSEKFVSDYSPLTDKLRRLVAVGA